MQTAYENRKVQRHVAPISGRLIATMVTDKTDRQIPADRRVLWNRLIADDALDARYAPEGASASWDMLPSARRSRRASRCVNWSGARE
ncbi:MAG: hypothetical protein ACJ8DI_12370 [Ktedonobacteraceae bacterium]